MFIYLPNSNIFILIGNPQGSHTVRTARQLILDNFNQSPEKIAEKTKLEYKAYQAAQAAALKKTKDGKKNINVGGENIAFDAKSAAQSKAKTDAVKIENDEMTMVGHVLILFLFLSNYNFLYLSICYF